MIWFHHVLFFFPFFLLICKWYVQSDPSTIQSFEINSLEFRKWLWCSYCITPCSASEGTGREVETQGVVYKKLLLVLWVHDWWIGCSQGYREVWRQSWNGGESQAFGWRQGVQHFHPWWMMPCWQVLGNGMDMSEVIMRTCWGEATEHNIIAINAWLRQEHFLLLFGLVKYTTLYSFLSPVHLISVCGISHKPVSRNKQPAVQKLALMLSQSCARNTFQSRQLS